MSNVVDTVAGAAATPEREQPHAALGLTDEQAYKILRGNAIRMLELDRV